MATEASIVKVEDQSNNNNVTEKNVIESQSNIGDDGQSNVKNEANGDNVNKDYSIEADYDNEQPASNQDDGNDDHEGDDDDDNAKSEDESEKTNLIVNYLPQQMTDDEFKELFAKFGAMKSCKIVRNRMTGYSYGFGFVDFETHEQAIKAIQELNGHELDTKKIKVAFARPAGQDIKQANLYVKNIPLSWTQDDLRKAFESYGNIIQVRVLGDNRGIAFVLYDLRKQAEEALEAMQGKKFEGSTEPLEINFAADKKSDKKKGNRRGRGGSSGGGANIMNNSGGDNNNGRTRERNNRGGVNRNNRNRSQSDTRQRSQSQGQRSMSNQRGGRNQNDNYNNNNNGFGPMRQNSQNRMHRFAPFAPVQQPAAAAMANQQPMAMAYAYQQPTMAAYNPYMMQPQQQQQQQMMQMAGQSMATAAVAAYPMGGAYQMAAAAAQPQQLAPMGYASVTSAQTMSNMYNMASNTMQNAAQMQPQLGQPMNNQMRGGQSGGTQSSNQSNQDGVTLFVYNIGPQSDESELRSMFAPYGQVLRCNVVRKTPGGETKGFGFVTLKDRAQANAAISNLNGSPRNGKTLQVSFKK